MSLSRIFKVDTATRSVKVYWCSEMREFAVRLYVEGKHYSPADYFTDDREDAKSTAQKMLDATMPESIPQAI